MMSGRAISRAFKSIPSTLPNEFCFAYDTVRSLDAPK